MLARLIAMCLSDNNQNNYGKQQYTNSTCLEKWNSDNQIPQTKVWACQSQTICYCMATRKAAPCHHHQKHWISLKCYGFLLKCDLTSISKFDAKAFSVVLVPNTLCVEHAGPVCKHIGNEFPMVADLQQKSTFSRTIYGGSSLGFRIQSLWFRV